LSTRTDLLASETGCTVKETLSASVMSFSSRNLSAVRVADKSNKINKVTQTDQFLIPTVRIVKYKTKTAYPDPHA